MASFRKKRRSAPSAMKNLPCDSMCYSGMMAYPLDEDEDEECLAELPIAKVP